MIAPLRQPDTQNPEVRHRLRRARQLVASALFPEPESPSVRPVPAWQAWAFAGWVLFATACYLAAMLHWL